MTRCDSSRRHVLRVSDMSRSRDGMGVFNRSKNGGSSGYFIGARRVHESINFSETRETEGPDGPPRPEGLRKLRDTPGERGRVLLGPYEFTQTYRTPLPLPLLRETAQGNIVF